MYGEFAGTRGQRLVIRCRGCGEIRIGLRLFRDESEMITVGVLLEIASGKVVSGKARDFVRQMALRNGYIGEWENGEGGAKNLIN